MVNLIQSVVEDFDFNSLHGDNSGDIVRKALLDKWYDKIKGEELTRLTNDLEFFANIHPEENTKQYLIQLIEKLYANKQKYVVNNTDELKIIIKKADTNADLNWLDVSKITNMDYLFRNSDFNGDISSWDVSNVETMRGMFWNSKFNGDISRWNVSKVDNMSKMFMSSVFNGDISKWDVSYVVNMNEMFKNSKFNQDISNWDVSGVKVMERMFESSNFLQDISNWKVSKVTDFEYMFFKNKKFIQQYEKILIDKWKLKLNSYYGPPYTNGMFATGYY